MKFAFFIVGATARDILLQHTHGIHPSRATLDVDISGYIGAGEAASSQGHKIAMDVLRQNAVHREPYEQVVEYFNALLRGLLD